MGHPQPPTPINVDNTTDAAIGHASIEPNNAAKNWNDVLASTPSSVESPSNLPRVTWKPREMTDIGNNAKKMHNLTKANGIFLVQLFPDKIKIVETLPAINKVKYLLSDSDENVWFAYDEGVQIIRKQLFTKNILPSTDSFAGQSTTINDSTFLLATKNSIYKVLITEDEIT